MGEDDFGPDELAGADECAELTGEEDLGPED
jgi:hypothetical protein